MIDPKLLRADIDTTAQQLKIKNYDLDIKAFLALEAQRKVFSQMPRGFSRSVMLMQSLWGN